MDINRLTLGDRVIGVSGIVLLIMSFFKWFSADAKGSGVTIADTSGWNGALAILAFLIAIAMVVYVVLKAIGTELPAWNWPLILLIAGVVAFVFILIKILVGVSVENLDDRFYDTSRKVPAWIGLVASAGLAVGGFLNFQAARAGGTTPGAPGAPGPRPGTGPTV